MDEKKIARINELYHKSKAEGLTDAEKEEQKALREEYLASIRNNIRSQLDNVTIVNPDGTMVDLGKTRGKKKGHQSVEINFQYIFNQSSNEYIY